MKKEYIVKVVVKKQYKLQVTANNEEEAFTEAKRIFDTMEWQLQACCTDVNYASAKELKHPIIKPMDYLKYHLGIEIAPEVEPLIKTNWELDCIMDASYIFDTNYVDLKTFNNAQEYCHNYFNGNINYNDDNYVDLSSSLTAQYSHYIEGEIPEDTNVVEVELESESRFYEIPA